MSPLRVGYIGWLLFDLERAGLPNVFDNTQMRANGTKNIIQAMATAGVRRLVCQSAFGTGDSHALLPIHYRFLIIPLFMRRLYLDHTLQEQHIKDSSLQWVIVRASVLTNGKRTEAYQTGLTERKKIRGKISRADTADFMLKQLTSEEWLYKTPYLSY